MTSPFLALNLGYAVHTGTVGGEVLPRSIEWLLCRCETQYNQVAVLCGSLWGFCSVLLACVLTPCSLHYLSWEQLRVIFLLPSL